MLNACTIHINACLAFEKEQTMMMIMIINTILFFLLLFLVFSRSLVWFIYSNCIFYCKSKQNEVSLLCLFGLWYFLRACVFVCVCVRMPVTNEQCIHSTETHTHTQTQTERTRLAADTFSLNMYNKYFWVKIINKNVILQKLPLFLDRNVLLIYCYPLFSLQNLNVWQSWKMQYFSFSHFFSFRSLHPN